MRPARTWYIWLVAWLVGSSLDYAAKACALAQACVPTWVGHAQFVAPVSREAFVRGHYQLEFLRRFEEERPDRPDAGSLMEPEWGSHQPG